MATLTVKNVPDELYERLKLRAMRSRRSINSEAIVLLEDALLQTSTDEAALIERVRAVRDEVSGYLTEEKRRSAVDEGRA